MLAGARNRIRNRRPDAPLTGDERKEAEKNNEAARLWISGWEAVNRNLRLDRVVDLSAAPLFLRGSGYTEGTLFPWTMKDFSLMDVRVKPPVFSAVAETSRARVPERS